MEKKNKIKQNQHPQHITTNWTHRKHEKADSLKFGENVS